MELVIGLGIAHHSGIPVDEEAVEVAVVVVVEDSKVVTEVMIMMKTAMAAMEVASEEATEVDGVASEDEEGAVVACALAVVITAVRVATSPEIALITIMSN